MHQCNSSANLHKATPVSAFSTMDNATTDHNANDLFYSDAEMGNLIHIKNEFEREFPVWTLFPTQRQLIDAMCKKATQRGFFVIFRGFSVL